MQAISKVKKDIEFNKNFSGLLEVLKNIAVAQFHILEKRLKVAENFDVVLDEFFHSFDPQSLQHPFLEERVGPSGVVAVTSDQGLLGGMNMRVVHTAVGFLKSGQDELIVIGEKGKFYARDFIKGSFTAFPGIKDHEQYAQAMELRNYLFQGAIAHKYGMLRVVYPRALSLVNQRVEIVTLLPWSAPTKEEPVHHINPSETIFESSLAGILEYLIFIFMGQKLDEIFSLSRLAELAARYIHLEESSQRIQQMNQKLKLRYFRLRHEMIDQNMRELFSSRIIYAG